MKEHVLPELADHTAREFERLLQRWARQNFPGAAQVGAWWTTKPLPYSVLSDLVQYKLPALDQADFKTRRGVTILLASRSGFSQQLPVAADNDDRIKLLDADVLLSQVR